MKQLEKSVEYYLDRFIRGESHGFSVKAVSALEADMPDGNCTVIKVVIEEFMRE